MSTKYSMSPERPSSIDGNRSTILDTSNMVIDASNGHIILQQTNGNHVLTNGNYATYTTVTSSSNGVLLSTGAAATTAMPLTTSTNNSSKLLVLEPNQLNENYVTTHEPNNVGNIVLLATEQMDIGSLHTNGIHGSNSSTDEELTSLTWLHDKNLLKGINLTCAAAAAAAAAAGTKSITNSVSPSIVQQHHHNHHHHHQINYQQMHQHQQNQRQSPTSDFLDDSCVSEDNASSAGNSCSDQGISIYSMETSPTTNNYQFSTTTTTGPGTTPINNNNNTINKNRNHFMASPSVNCNTNGTNSTTQIVHLSSDGKIVDSKTMSTNTVLQMMSTAINGSANVQTTNNNCHSPTSSVSSTISTSISSSSSSSSSTTTTPHQHFHKKYIRETLNQTNLENNCSSNGLMLASPVKQEFSPIKYENDSGFIDNHNKDYSSSSSSSTLTSTASTLLNVYNRQPFYIPKMEPTNLMDVSSNSSSCSPRQSTPTLPITILPQHQQPTSSTAATAAVSELATHLTSSSIQKYANGTLSSSSSPSKLKHPTNLPYDPLIHTLNKPPLSFSSLIFLAIEDSIEKALPVKEIYAWIVAHYPYFKTAPTGWKNSVRHNLSLNKCFQKVEKAPNMGKGSLWRVEQQYKQNLIQALTRSSYHPCTTSPTSTEKVPSSYKLTPRPLESPPALKSNARPLDAELFPRLSKYMSEMASTENSPPTTPARIDEDDLNDHHHHNNHHYNDDIVGHNESTAGYIINGNSLPTTNLNITTNNNHHHHHYYPITNGDTKNLIIYNGTGNGVDGGGGGIVGNGTSSPSLSTSSQMQLSAISPPEIIERIARDWGADSIDDVNAATAMLALKHGPKVFSESFQNGNSPVITSSPSEDHTYSAGGIGSKRSTTNNSDNNSNGTSSDAAYESSEESNQQNHNITKEELEARRHAEGVDAFLTFATEVSTMSSPIKRPPSSSIDDAHLYMENIPHNNNNNNHYIETTIVSHPPFNYLSSPSPPKKSRSRTLRTKLKKKTGLR